MNIQELQSALSDAGKIGALLGVSSGVQTGEALSPTFKAAADKALSMDVQQEIIEELEVTRLLEELQNPTEEASAQSDEQDSGYTNAVDPKAEKYNERQMKASEKATEKLAENRAKVQELQEGLSVELQTQLEEEQRVRLALAMHKREEIKKNTGIDVPLDMDGKDRNVSLADLGDLKAPAQVIAMDTQEKGMTRDV